MSTQPVTRGWIPDDQNLGARLALVRQRFGWNMKEAALACAIPQGSWREWELKDRVPRDYPGMMEKIAARTDVDLMWLMTGRTPGSGDDGSPDREAGASEKLLRLDSNQQPSDYVTGEAHETSGTTEVAPPVVIPLPARPHQPLWRAA